MFVDKAVGRIVGAVGIIVGAWDDTDGFTDVHFAMLYDRFVFATDDSFIVVGATLFSVCIDTGVANTAPSTKLPVILIKAVCQPR
jgi:hypothetical protein